jgi:hypothetical protein
VKARVLPLLALVAMPALLAACSSIEGTTAEPERRASEGLPATSLLTGEPLHEALRQLRAAAGPSVMALELTVFPERAVLQARHAEQPGTVVQYEYRDGKLAPPVEVELRGPGQLEDNLFPLEEAALAEIPSLSRQAVERVDAKHGSVHRVVVRRNLPRSSDVQLRVFVSSPARDGHVDADADGKIVDD